MGLFGDVLGSGERPASQALLQPTGKPVESKGPFSSAGPGEKRSAKCTRINQQKGLQFGPRSTGQSAMGHLSWNMHRSERWRAIRPRPMSSHPTLLLTRIGKLYPSTSDTKKIPSSHEDNRFNLNLSQTHRRNYPEYLGRCSA